MLIKKRISKYSIGELGNLVTYIPTQLYSFPINNLTIFRFFLGNGGGRGCGGGRGRGGGRRGGRGHGGCRGGITVINNYQ